MKCGKDITHNLEFVARCVGTYIIMICAEKRKFHISCFKIYLRQDLFPLITKIAMLNGD